jgi:glycosyltransferase involved in cell wall biosynthesis
LIRQGYYPLDPRVRREVDALVRAGHEVEVICLRRPDERRFESQGLVTVHRIPIPTRRAGRFNYVIQYAAFFTVASVLVAVLHVRRRFDVVQVNSMPDSLVFSAIVPRLLGARVLLDLHECMPEFYAVKFGVGLRHPAVRFVAWMEQAAIRFADQVITCTEQMRSAFVSRGGQPDKIDVILNSSDEDEFDPGRATPSTPVPGELRLICHGTVERIFGIDVIVRAVALLKDEIPGLHLDIYGEGSALPEIQTLIIELGISDRVYLSQRWVPLDQLVRAITDADVGIVALRRDIFRDLTHSNKMFDYITMRKPAIVSRTGSVEAYFDESCFQMFTAGDERDLARAIRELHDDPELGQQLVSRATHVNEPYRWPHQRQRYQEIVDRLVAGRARGSVTEPATSTAEQSYLVAVAWDNYQGRTEALANALGGHAWYLRGRPRAKALLPVRYLFDSIRMWRLLRRHRPGVLMVITPPVVAPLVASFWCATHRCRLVVDCHTGAFHSWKWRWSGRLLRPVCRQAAATLVHTLEDEELVQAWGARALLLPDDLPAPRQASPLPRPPGLRAVVAGSLDGNEPVAAVIEAARLVPDVEFRLTGDERRVPISVRQGAPDNAIFTGWLDYTKFLGELLAADVVAVFSTDPHIMNRAAFEAIGLERPLVLSDLPGLRSRFGPAALFSPNDPPAMADAVLLALGRQEELAARSKELQVHLRAQHQRGLARLSSMLQLDHAHTGAPAG